MERLGRLARSLTPLPAVSSSEEKEEEEESSYDLPASVLEELSVIPSRVEDINAPGAAEKVQDCGVG